MKTRFHWIVGGGIVLGVLILLGAGTIEDSGIFQSLKLGGRTNLVSDDNVDLTYNGAHYQRSVPILNNLTNGIGTNLTSLLAAAVQAGQTNDGTANWSASGTTNSTLPGAASVNSLVSTNGLNTGGLTNTGVTVHTPSAIQSLTATSNVLVNASTMRVNGSGGAVTLTSTPSIQTNSIADGTVITIRGTDDTNTVTLQDYRTLAGTCLAMEVTSVTLKNGSEMRFQWSNGNQRWQEMAFSANSSQIHPFQQFTISDGSISGPSFAFSASTNTGISRSALNGTALVLSLAGTRVGLFQFHPAVGTSSNGQGNTFLGYNAGALNNTSSSNAYNNTFIGGQAGQANDDGYQNTIVGSNAGSQNTHGNQNTFLGQGAGYANIVSSGLTFVGFHAGLNLTNNSNTAVGQYAGQGAAGSQSAKANVFVGDAIGIGITSGSENSALGHQAGNAITSGSQNDLLGSAAGISITTGSDNVLIGRRSGYTQNDANAITTGSQNIFIGTESGPSTATQLTNAIGIGYRVLVGVNNTTVIGNASTTDTYLAGSVHVSGATNQVIFGATNTAPVSAAAPTRWISVQVSGESTVYRLPLYE